MLSKHQTQNSCKKRNASSRWTTADSTRDKELDLDSPEACHLANEVLTLRNRAGALDYLYRCCQFKGRQNAQPALILPDLEITKVDRLEVPRQIEAGAALKTTPA